MEQPQFNNIGKQLDIDFNAISPEQELTDVANKYKIPDRSKIYKDPQGVFRFIANNESVEDWDAQMKALDAKEDNDIYHHN